MDYIKPLPQSYVQRYKGWRATQYEENKAWYARLASEGQRPRAMVISCCDSRLHVTSIFGADSGEFFIHRNVANLVPVCNPDGDIHGTSATVEYAVTALKVSNILVLGHSDCGGVEACLDMCAGNAPELEQSSSFVGRWMDILSDDYEAIRDIEDRSEQLQAFEKAGVLTSVKNLMTFPFVAAGVADGSLALHGLWHDIATGVLEAYDPTLGRFRGI